LFLFNIILENFFVFVKHFLEIYRGMGRKKEAKEWIKKAVDCRREIKDPKVKESERMMEEG